MTSTSSPAASAESPGCSILAVHPGALATSAWDPLIDGLPPGYVAKILDLQRVREFALAGMDSRISSPSIDDLADMVATVIERERPTVVIGWSFGGVVAQAALSRRLSHRPRALVALDSIAAVPDYVMDDDFDRSVLTSWFAMYLCAKQGVERPGGPLPLGGGQELLDWTVRAGAVRPDTSVAGINKVYEAFLGGMLRNNSLARAHHVRPHALPTFLVRPAEGLLPEGPDLGWLSLYPATLIVPCAGDHYTVFDQPVVGAIVRGLLQEPPRDHVDSAGTRPATLPATLIEGNHGSLQVPRDRARAAAPGPDADRHRRPLRAVPQVAGRA